MPTINGFGSTAVDNVTIQTNVSGQLEVLETKNKLYEDSLSSTYTFTKAVSNIILVYEQIQGTKNISVLKNAVAQDLSVIGVTGNPSIWRMTGTTTFNYVNALGGSYYGSITLLVAGDFAVDDVLTFNGMTPSKILTLN